MLSVVKDNASQLLKQFGLEDDMDSWGRGVAEKRLFSELPCPVSVSAC